MADQEYNATVVRSRVETATDRVGVAQESFGESGSRYCALVVPDKPPSTPVEICAQSALKRHHRDPVTNIDIPSERRHGVDDLQLPNPNISYAKPGDRVTVKTEIQGGRSVIVGLQNHTLWKEAQELAKKANERK